MKWNANDAIDLKATYPSLRYLDDYRRIQAFLTSEKQVDAALDGLNQAAATATSAEAFQDFLKEAESREKFNADVVTVKASLPPDTFLGYLSKCQPMLDVGAGARHGFNTHRVQWMLVSIARFSALIDLEMPLKVLYMNMACYNAYLNVGGMAAYKLNPVTQEQEIKGFRFLWDDLFDRLFTQRSMTCNATSPEFLKSEYLPLTPYRHLAAVWT